jgi:hypothetical protein
LALALAIRLLLAVAGIWTCSRIHAQTVVFDFDTGEPLLSTYQLMPPTQTKGGVTAYFSASSGAYSIQTLLSLGYGYELSQFSGKFLVSSYDDSVLDISFSQPITNISITFATAEYASVELPTLIELAAFTNSTASPVITSVKARAGDGDGDEDDTMPMGSISLSSVVPFDVVRMRIAPQQTDAARQFYVDNIVVQASGGNMFSITTLAAPSYGGMAIGSGYYIAGTNASLLATANPGYEFVNWTENGAMVHTSPRYDFSISANRTLVANFAPRLEIVCLPPDSCVIYWPSSAVGYVLRQSSNLTPTGSNWSDVIGPIDTVGNQNVMLDLTDMEIRHYRLEHP